MFLSLKLSLASGLAEPLEPRGPFFYFTSDGSGKFLNTTAGPNNRFLRPCDSFVCAA